MSKLLLVDDDPKLARLLGEFLGQHGYTLQWAALPSRGVQMLRERPALVLLDVMMPEIDGFEFCRRVRGAGDRVPIIMLTARGEADDRIRGLKLGADDYLAKPFDPQELLARIEAVLRRSGSHVTPVERLDADARTFHLDGREISLTPGEYRLMEALTARPGKTFTRTELLAALEPGAPIEGIPGMARAIDIHMSRLRGKIEPEPRKPRHLLTVRGRGYRFVW